MGHNNWLNSISNIFIYLFIFTCFDILIVSSGKSNYAIVEVLATTEPLRNRVPKQTQDRRLEQQRQQFRERQQQFKEQYQQQWRQRQQKWNNQHREQLQENREFRRQNQERIRQRNDLRRRQERNRQRELIILPP